MVTFASLLPNDVPGDPFFAHTLGLGAEFSPADGSGKFKGGKSPFLDGACRYQQTLQVELAPDGSTMKIAGTITELTGLEHWAVDGFGKKRAVQQCRKPGDSGIDLMLSRRPTNEYFSEVRYLLDAQTKPLVFKD